MNFTSPSKGELNFNEVVSDILSYVSEDLSRSYQLIVGSDSHSTAQGTCFVSAIIIHRQGQGGRYYYNRINGRRINSLRQRIFYEASLSLSLADQLKISLKEHGCDDMKVEIHLDVGVKGETRDLIKEVIGMIVASGFAARIKPDACAASKVADKYTK